MTIAPIVSSLRHHRLTAALLVLQVAFTCAVVANVLFVLSGYVRQIHTPSGIAEHELVVVNASGVQADANPEAQRQTDLAALRAIPGVREVAAVSNASLPFSSSMQTSTSCNSEAAIQASASLHWADGVAGCTQPYYYTGSHGLASTLGVRVLAGRDLAPDDDHAGDVPNVLISDSLARLLWPGQTAVGKTLYGGGGSRSQVVGVFADIAAPLLTGTAQDHRIVIGPQPAFLNIFMYVLRTAPERRAEVLAAATAALTASGPIRLMPPDAQQRYDDIRAASFQRKSTMVGLLSASAIGLLFVTALGIGGLASFWVQQRTRQIGIRRAIGATRRDIRRYFQTENLLIVGAGAALGLLLGSLLNLWLMGHYDLQRLPWHYLALGAVALVLLGQLAVLGPARRAAAVPPMVATRSL